MLLIVADSKNQVVFDSLGALRNQLAKQLGLIQKGTYDLLWLIVLALFL